jgi:hypothetical protein
MYRFILPKELVVSGNIKASSEKNINVRFILFLLNKNNATPVKTINKTVENKV